jgi:hypothetical protein
LRVSAAVRRIALPTIVDPVNDSFATSGCALISAPCDDIEHACRKPRFVQRLGDDARLQRAHLARLDDGRATGRQRRRELAADEARIAVPWRDQSGDAERLHHDFRRTRFTHERIVFEHVGRFQQHIARVLRHPASPRHGRAVLFDDRLEKLIFFRDDSRVHALQHVDAFTWVRPRKRRKCALRRRDGMTRVFGVGQAHAADHLFGSRIEEIEKLAAVRRDERAVDIDSVDDLHD